MATKTSSPTPGRAGKRVTRAELNRLVPGLIGYLEDAESGAGFRLDFEEELEDLVRPRWVTPPPPMAAQAGGVRFDVGEVDRFLRFARRLRHIKGRTYAGKPLILDLWQVVYVIGPVLGWRRPDGNRYFSELYLEVPRKNGKSTLAAALALFLLTADNEPGAEVISAAKDKSQARAVFDVAARMAEHSAMLRPRLNVLRRSGIINFEAADSTYTVVSSDRAGDRKHGLNLHGAVVDELHVITDGELIGTLETSTGSREQPLIIYITTAGIESESPVWAEKRTRAVNAATGTAPAPDLFAVVFAADPKVARSGAWDTEAAWRSANPGYGRSLRPDFIAREAAKARQSNAALNRFLRLHLNVPQDALSSWIEQAIYDRSASIVDEADLEGARCFGGLDLASSLDLAALVLVFPDSTDKALDVVARFWTPEATLRQRATRDRGDYEAWVKAGFLRTTPGETIDLDAIELELVELLGRFDVQGIAYDPWGSLQLRTHLEDAGANIFELRQGFASLSGPMKELERLIFERGFRHGGNPVLRFCFSNVTVALDPAGNMKPDRKRSRSRIDGVAASVDAVAAWLRDLGGTASAYEDHGLDVAR